MTMAALTTVTVTLASAAAGDIGSSDGVASLVAAKNYKCDSEGADDFNDERGSRRAGDYYDDCAEECDNENDD